MPGETAMREVPIQGSEPAWRAIAGAQILFVAFRCAGAGAAADRPQPQPGAARCRCPGTLLPQTVTARQLPIFLGSSLPSSPPSSIRHGTWGMPATMGALACVSIVYFIFAALVNRHGAEIVHRFMPPVVIGPIIMIIGLSLAAVAVNMAMGKTGDGSVELVPYGTAMLVALVSLGTTVVASVFARGFLRLVPILAGAGGLHARGGARARRFRHDRGGAVVRRAAVRGAGLRVGRDSSYASGGARAGDRARWRRGGDRRGHRRDYTEKPGLPHPRRRRPGGAFAGLVGGPPVTTYSEVPAPSLTPQLQPQVMTWAAVLAVVMMPSSASSMRSCNRSPCR